ncbi:MAG: GGDEF domain-containing protein, partial [Nitrospinota bacterium]
GEAGSFTTDHYKKLKNEILTFFVAKSNEAAVIVQERLELKNIIAALASEMSTISVASDSYNDNLSSYAKKLGEADSLTEILDVKQKILNETGEIQKENQKLKNSMKETAALLSASSKKISDLEKELGKARMEMMKDTLTRLYNRRAFDERIEEQLNRFKRYGEGFCLIFMDLDHFKRVNDTYGHVAGDIVLKTVASIAKESIRSMDFIGRYGGEEFVAIIEKTETVSGKKVAEKIRKSIGGHEFIYKNQKVDVQVSLGVTGSRGGDTPQSITERADSALYQAKERGRNQVASV